MDNEFDLTQDKRDIEILTLKFIIYITDMCWPTRIKINFAVLKFGFKSNIKFVQFEQH